MCPGHTAGVLEGLGNGQLGNHLEAPTLMRKVPPFPGTWFLAFGPSDLIPKHWKHGSRSTLVQGTEGAPASPTQGTVVWSIYCPLPSNIIFEMP